MTGTGSAAFGSVVAGVRVVLAARHDRFAAPFTGIDVEQRLGQHPPVAEGVDEAGLPLPIGLITGGVAGVPAVGPGCGEHVADVGNADHHLIGGVPGVFVISQFTHDEFSAFAVKAELNPMTRTDADMLDEP